MDSQLIAEAASGTLAGTMSFPDAVGRLIEAGVEAYHVDYAALTKTFYGRGGAVVVTPLNFEGLPPIAATFSAEGLRAAILDSQQNEQKFRDFSRRAMESGVIGYVAFLSGKRVTYWGRLGDQHTEWFPVAK